MNKRPNRLAALVFAAVTAIPTAASASTLVGPINADGTWYSVGKGFQPNATDFSVGYTFSLPTDANGKTQILDLSDQIDFFTPIASFSWQLDGGTKNPIVSNTIQSLGLISQGTHTLTFSGQGTSGTIFGFSGQAAFLQNVSVPLPAAWLMFGSGLIALGATRRFRKG
jgi:hypothetical protein